MDAAGPGMIRGEHVRAFAHFASSRAGPLPTELRAAAAELAAAGAATGAILGELRAPWVAQSAAAALPGGRDDDRRLRLDPHDALRVLIVLRCVRWVRHGGAGGSWARCGGDAMRLLVNEGLGLETTRRLFRAMRAERGGFGDDPAPRTDTDVAVRLDRWLSDCLGRAHLSPAAADALNSASASIGEVTHSRLRAYEAGSRVRRRGVRVPDDVLRGLDAFLADPAQDGPASGSNPLTWVAWLGGTGSQVPKHPPSMVGGRLDRHAARLVATAARRSREVQRTGSADERFVTERASELAEALLGLWSVGAREGLAAGPVSPGRLPQTAATPGPDSRRG